MRRWDSVISVHLPFSSLQISSQTSCPCVQRIVMLFVCCPCHLRLLCDIFLGRRLFALIHRAEGSWLREETCSSRLMNALTGQCWRLVVITLINSSYVYMRTSEWFSKHGNCIYKQMNRCMFLTRYQLVNAQRINFKYLQLAASK